MKSGRPNVGRVLLGGIMAGALINTVPPYRITKNKEDAEDASLESVLKAFIHFGDFNRASSFATWLTRISVN